jgi:peptidoglycan biosynthesis protein MviN/MurJ (putative lipid II flippase)
MKSLETFGGTATSVSAEQHAENRATLALNVIAMFNLTTGYFLSQRAFASLAEGDLLDAQNIARHSVGLTLAMRSAGYGTYSAVGIVLGGVCGSWINLVLHWWLLARRIGPLFDRAALVGVGRLAAGAAAAAGAGYGVRTLLEGRLPDSFLGALGLLAAVLVAGAIPYLLIARKPPRASRVELEIPPDAF